MTKDELKKKSVKYSVIVYIFFFPLKNVKKKTKMGEVTWEKEVDFSALLKHEEEAAGQHHHTSQDLTHSLTHTIVS